MGKSEEIKIRRAARGDLPRLIELMKGLTITTSNAEADGASSLAEYERVFEQIERDPQHHLLVADVGGQVVGSGDLLIVPNLSHRGMSWAIVENVIVDENMRRKGIARELMKHMIDLAKKSRCYKIGLSSNRRREGAHRFYESLGFQQYGLGFRIYF
jgi:GNAT superfamily N-acetyltransferase